GAALREQKGQERRKGKSEGKRSQRVKDLVVHRPRPCRRWWQRRIHDNQGVLQYLWLNLDARAAFRIFGDKGQRPKLTESISASSEVPRNPVGYHNGMIATPLRSSR